ncbi:PREDICTED: uncharacterized protein LOC105450093 isoform X2 [Wasmannia auropunctata]|uniref:uncharacterized protein LOC105450093 isoform X2 n=1 Tax=Wasmannia auropunctata TaxID=64793 RepID=UPI0005F07BF4|nr:PREDICTED: uncharacterized protein LOC105450093 isoform X2 [Wasmannia auropunctata]
MSWKPHTDAAVMRVIKDNLLRWTCERQATGCPLDRHLLRDKALELVGEHGLTDFKYSEKWLTSFLKKYGLSLNEEPSGPVFNNYRLWINMMRSVITQYKHKDLFHVDELTMYSDVSPTSVSVSTARQDEPDTSMKKTTVLLCCNASGTEKLPLLICGSYLAVIMGKNHVYSHSEDASVNDGLFREWLTQLNCRMSSNNRRILLLLHRNRIGALRDLELSNIRHVFFPDDFPPLLRPLKRDVFHFVKMAYRRNFQRTSFRTDDCFLEIRCDAWEDLETEVPFRKFVTFDDYLTAGASRKQCESTGRRHSYNLRSRDVDWKKTNPLKRSHDEAQLDEDLYEEAKPCDESTSRENKDIAGIPTSARSASKVVDIQTIEGTARGSKSDDVHSTTRASVNESWTDTEYDRKRDEMASEERCKNARVSGNVRSIGSPETDNVNGDVASQQVFDDASAVDSGAKRPSARTVCRAIPRDETVSDLDGNVERFPRKSLKRRSVDVDESRNNSDDDEPERKRSRSDSDWTKQYETSFVFGPFDLARTATTVSADALAISGSGVPQPRRSCETERSIFTIRPRRD